MPDVVVTGLGVDYGDSAAVADISFTAEDGEFLTLVGPSGCGKTTTLMSLAGLVTPTRGRIVCAADVFFDAGKGPVLPPEERNCGVVFQSYAVWPHMTVYDNVAFPLTIRRVRAGQARQLVEQTLALVEMSDYAKRYPHELSGGQQQRVALARALVYSPGVLLLDEPLSNLDAKLREQARLWLKRLQEQIQLTTIFVTHDQDEAFALSDRVVVMNAGRIEQIGRPEQVYREPANRFVADFMGSSNLLTGRIVDDGTPSADGAAVVLDESAVTLWAGPRAGLSAGDLVTISARPEELMLLPVADADGAENVFAAEIVAKTFLGSRYQYIVDLRGTEVTVITGESHDVGKVALRIPAQVCRVFPRGQETRV